MQLYAHLIFDGHCEAAFKYYEEHLRGRISLMMTYDQMPSEVGAPPEWRKKIGHATFALGDWILSGSDALPGGYRKPQGFGLQFNLSDLGEAERIFKALAEDGSVEIPLQETFWAFRFGALVDQFGIPWMINCERTELRSGHRAS